MWHFPIFIELWKTLKNRQLYSFENFCRIWIVHWKLQIKKTLKDYSELCKLALFSTGYISSFLLLRENPVFVRQFFQETYSVIYSFFLLIVLNNLTKTRKLCLQISGSEAKLKAWASQISKLYTTNWNKGKEYLQK